MKDPLQTDQTPYEVLGVTREAGPAEIDQAFRRALVARRATVPRLMEAKRKLEAPADRVLVDIFQYDPETLATLTPNPLPQVEALGLPRRAATAAAWEEQLRRTFPEAGLMHSLGVLWYWWARYAEENPTTAGLDGTAPVELWGRAIAFWAAVVAGGESWKRWTWVPKELRPQAPAHVADMLRNQLQEREQAARTKNDTAGAYRYRQLELALSTELIAARAVAKAPLRTDRGKLACGPLLLGHIGLLESTQRQVDAALKMAPNNEPLIAVREALSPYATVQVLLRKGDPEGALRAIDLLPTSGQAQPELRRLRVRALLEKGKQEASVDQITSALATWNEALRIIREGTPDAELPRAIASAVVDACQQYAAKRQQHERGDAIAILEMGLELAPEDRLRLTLAELLLQEGIERFFKAKEPVAQGTARATPQVRLALVEATALMDRAASLGSPRAAEQAGIAREHVALLDAGVQQQAVSARVQTLLDQAVAAANRAEWDVAIARQREVLALLGAGAQSWVRVNLAGFLASGGVAKANKGVELLNTATQGKDFERRMLNEELAQNSRVRGGAASGRCARSGCNEGMFGHSQAQAAEWRSLALPDGTTAMICPYHVREVEEILQPVRPTAEITTLIERGLRELREAAEIDPSNDSHRKNRDDLARLADSIGTVAGAAPAHTVRSQAGAPSEAHPHRRVARGAVSGFERRTVHGNFVAVLYLLTLAVGALFGVMFLPLGGSVYALWKETLLGRLAISGAGGFLAFHVLLLIRYGDMSGVSETWQTVCHARWRNKAPGDRWMEICVYAWPLLCGLAVATRVGLGRAWALP